MGIRVLACGVGLFGLLRASPLGCNEKSDCEKACARFAACKAARKNGGEAVLGEGRAPIDDACMTKCERQPDIFAVCEGRLKECDKMLACSGSLRW
jgi:hypothetical protein